MNFFGTKTPKNLEPRKTELQQIIQNTSNLFGKANTLTMTLPQDISDKWTIQFSVSTTHEDHTISIVARSQVSQKTIEVDVIIQTPKIHTLHLADPAVKHLGNSAVKFSIPIHTPENNIHPYIMREESEQNKAPDNFINMLKEIVVYWMPVIQIFDKITGWYNTINTNIKKDRDGYIMNVKSEQFWSNPRFIELMMPGLKTQNYGTEIMFRQGYNSSQTPPRIIKRIDLNAVILSYLDNFKLFKYESRYEELHQRIVNLIDS
jgi:hypothetical protein